MARQLWFINHYEHEGCIDPETGENTAWDDEWDCMCNDHCPTCDAEIEPYDSTEVPHHGP